MAQERFYVVSPDGSPAPSGKEMSIEELRGAVRKAAGQPAVVFLPKTEGMALVLREIYRFIPGLVAEKTVERREERIEGMLRYLLDFDPLGPVEARIDAANAEMRRDFLAAYPVVEAAAVHDRAGYGGVNKAQTAAAWKRANRILGLPYAGRIVYPLFQFDDDGQPWPLMQPVLRSLPADRSAWQRAFWLVSPNEWLDERVPADALRNGDERVIQAAEHAGAVAIG